MDHTEIHNKVQDKFALVGMDNHREAAFVDKLALDIVNSIVLPFRVHFEDIQLSQTKELPQ